MVNHIFLPAHWKNKLALIFPVYNEEAALMSVVRDWVPVAARCEGVLVFINDGSKDRTLDILKRAARTFEGQIIIIDKINSGHGHSCLVGYQWAVENGFEWIFQTDSDGQTIAGEFYRLWFYQHQRNFPFVFGIRNDRLDGWHRPFVSLFLRLVIGMVFGIFVKDANVPFRLMRVDLLKKVIPHIPEDLYLSNAFLTVVLEKFYSIHWVAISFLPRKGGKESVAPFKFLSMGWRTIREFWPHRNLTPELVAEKRHHS